MVILYLGKSLHYVQDGVVPIDKHDYYERAIAKLKKDNIDVNVFDDDLIFIDYLQNLLCFDKPRNCLIKAVKISKIIGKIVFMSEEQSDRFIQKLNELREASRILKDYIESSKKLSEILGYIDKIQAKINILVKSEGLKFKLLKILGLYKRSLKVNSEKLNELINESNQLKEKVKALELGGIPLVKAFNYA